MSSRLFQWEFNGHEGVSYRPEPKESSADGRWTLGNLTPDDRVLTTPGRRWMTVVKDPEIAPDTVPGMLQTLGEVTVLEAVTEAQLTYYLGKEVVGALTAGPNELGPEPEVPPEA